MASIDGAFLEVIAEKAGKSCMISCAIQGNVDIQLEELLKLLISTFK
ncbi:hypothetical protein M3936_12600 [Sutcliffiella horikoshii]|nr:hypothetical protein [Sutcliffiella horikoshii]MCM3618422.1 hypothetical protein [Sutcliffiella horikoshii]